VSFVTDFADQAVLLPLVLMVALALAAAGWRRGAGAWILVVVTMLAVILAGKVIAYACAGTLLLDTGLKSPSGHTASAAVVYGGLCSLLAPVRWRPRVLALGAAALVAFVIGMTRLALHAHTQVDVLVGAVIGIAGAVLLAHLAGERPAGMRRVGPLAVAIGVVIVFHGARLEAESKIQSLAHLLWPPTVTMAAGQAGEGVAALLPLHATMAHVEMTSRRE
jgi:membrane-associated phospholipid phosphatase